MSKLWVLLASIHSPWIIPEVDGVFSCVSFMRLQIFPVEELSLLFRSDCYVSSLWEEREPLSVSCGCSFFGRLGGLQALPPWTLQCVPVGPTAGASHALRDSVHGPTYPPMSPAAFLILSQAPLPLPLHQFLDQGGGLGAPGLVPAGLPPLSSIVSPSGLSSVRVTCLRSSC